MYLGGRKDDVKTTYTSGITVRYPFSANWSAMSWVFGKNMPRASVMRRMAFVVGVEGVAM
jgi:hypothetical protein